MPDLRPSDPHAATAASREWFIDHAHEGNGTGCRCCSLVDDGHLAALLDLEDAVRVYLSPLPYRQELAAAKDRGDVVRAVLARIDEVRDAR